MKLQEIAERCKQGDREAFALLYTATRQQLYDVCLRYVKNETVADDLVHDAFLLVFSKIGELKDTKSTEAWLATVARRVALLYLRKQRQQQQEPLSSCAVAASQPLTVGNHGESWVAVSEILAAVDTLPDGYRRVFRLSVLEGMTHKEIAALLNIEPHSSSSQLARAKRMLQRMVSGYWVVLLVLLVPVAILLLRHVAPSPVPSSVGAGPVPASNGPVPARKRVCPPSTTKSSPLSPPLSPSKTANSQPVHADSSLADVSQTGTPIVDTSQTVTPSEETSPPGSLALPAHTVLPPSEHVSQATGHWTIDLAYSGQWPMLYGQSSMQLPFADADTNPMVSDSVSRHRLPLTVALSAGYRLGRHWQLGTGLSYTRMTSDFSTGNTYASMQQHQTVQYLGIPVSMTCRWPLSTRARLSLVTSVSTTLHLPLHSTMESHYLLPGGTIAEPVTKSLHPGLQWSAGFGVGLQYEVAPPVSLFVQPSLQHYFRSSGGVSTWNTEHPLVLSVPFGIIISF